MKIVFMGTPDFAEGVLKSLYESNYDITAVVTQPDKPKGRSGKMIASPVKEYAMEKGIPVFQPDKIRLPENVEVLRKFEADIFVVAAFGQILSKEILDMPKYGCINIHASILPKYRGAAPIQWAIADGLEETGVTIQQMNEGVDTGDIISCSTVKIDARETGDSLFDKLMHAGAKLVCETLPEIEKGNITLVPQNEDEATHAKMLKKEMGCVDFAKSAAEIDCLIRAFTPWPGGYTYLDGRMIKLKECYPSEEMESGNELVPGQVCGVNKEEIIIKCGRGALIVKMLQPEGKKSMSAHDFMLGNKIEIGMKFG